jgi:AsmA protein
MGKLLKIIFSLLGLLVLLLIVAIVVLPMVIDPNDYKDQITATVKEQTGRTLDIDGDISLSVFPWLGADIGPTRLGNAAGFEPPNMASMEAVEVRIKLIPLLRKKLEVNTVILKGLKLNLAKDAQGRANWDDLVKAADKDDKAKDEKAEDKGAGLQDLAIGGIEITDAQLVWDDRAAGSRYEINDLSLTTGEIGPGQAFDLDLGFRLAASEPAIDGKFTLKGEVLVTEGVQGVNITDARIAIDATGQGLPGGKLQVNLGSDVALDLAAGTLSLPQIEINAYNLAMTGTVSGTGVNGDNPQFTGNLRLASFSPRDLIKALGQPVPETADSSALKTADASLDWDASTKHFNAGKVLLHLDDTTVNGTLGVRSFAAPAVTFKLDVDRINVDRYMPPPPPEGEQAAKQDKATEAGELPMEALRKLNLDGSISIAEMTAINMKYRDARLQVRAKDGVVRLHPFGASMYQGSYDGDITLDVRQSKPRLSVNEKISGVQAGPLLLDLTGNDRLQGKADVTAKFTGTGITPDELKQSVSGQATFSFSEGAVKGVNIASLIRKAQAALKGQSAPPGDQPDQTDFALLKGTANVTNGLVTNDDLILQSPFLRITGKGQTHLAKETIDYTLTTKLVGSLEGQGGKSLEELKGVSIPVQVGGTYSKPTYKPDISAALSEAAKAKVDEKVEEKKEEIKEKIEKKLGDKLGDDLLKGLFK